ncbi:MAG: hypothetical protein M0R38_06330 [Bacteroidia bacterium]|nr:hypothetical protein [Bacteroidia bacterium]
MKKTFLILLSSSLILAACSGNSNDNTEVEKIQNNEKIIQESEDELLDQIEDEETIDSATVDSEPIQADTKDIIDVEIKTKK